jgi:outer membrane protein assembly factor BamB
LTGKSGRPQSFLAQRMSRRQALIGFGGVVAAGLTVAGCDGGTGTPAARTETASAAAVSSGWPQPSAGRLIWRAETGAGTGMTLVAADAMVYAGTSVQTDGNCLTYAFDAPSGYRVWRTPGTAGPLPYAAGAGAVYGFELTGSDHATSVVASGAASGRTLWTYDAGPMLDNAGVGFLTYAGNSVYIAGGTTDNNDAAVHTVAAVDAQTGRRRWAVSLTDSSQQPAVADGVVYASTISSVVALNAATGKRMWKYTGVDGNGGALVAVDRTVFGSDTTQCFALDGATGARLWRTDLSTLPIAATGGIVLFESLAAGETGSDTQSTVWARHARSGALAWKQTFDGVPALAAGGVLYIAGNDRRLLAIATATGKTAWSYRLADAVAGVAADGGVVYAGDTKGAIYAIGA